MSNGTEGIPVSNSSVEKLKYEEVSFTLKNGMKISFGCYGSRTESSEGEHFDLIVEHPNGERARMMVTCSGSTYGDKYIQFDARVGQPLKVSGHVYSEYGPSFQPENLDYVALSKEGKIESVLNGIPDSFRLNLESSSEE